MDKYQELLDKKKNIIEKMKEVRGNLGSGTLDHGYGAVEQADMEVRVLEARLIEIESQLREFKNIKK